MTESETTPTRIALLICVCAGAITVLAPLLAIAFFSPPFVTQSDTSLLEEINDPWLWGLLGNSLRLALYTTALSLAVGVLLGIRLAMRSGSFMVTLGLAHLLPLSLPPYIVGLSVASLTGANGLLARFLGTSTGIAASSWLYGESGAVFVLFISLSPIVTLTTALFARSLNPRLIEAALNMRQSSAVLMRIVLPLIAPGALFGALVVFVFAFSEVAVPQLLGIKVYATAVFTRLADLSFEPSVAIARSLPPLFITAVAAAGLYLIDRRGRSSLGLKSMLPNALLDGASKVLANYLLGITAIIAVFPIVALFFAAILGPGGGPVAILQGKEALLNSLFYAFSSSCVMLVIAIPSAWAWSNHPNVGGVACMPILFGFLVPAAVLGTGLIVMWNRPETQWIYQGSGIMVLGLVARYAFLPIRAIKLGFDRSVTSTHEAARIFEASALRRLFKIYIMGNLDTIAGGFAIAFLTCFRDLDTVVLFYPPGGEPLSVRTMTIEANAPPGQTAANGALQVAFTGLILIAAYLLLKGKKR